MRFRCTKHGRGPKFFEFSDDNGDGICPQCGAQAGIGHAVFPLIDIHFIAMNPQGPILGAEGRQHVACERKRDGLAKHIHDEYAATDDPRVVTCPSCQGTQEWQDMAKGFAAFDKQWALELRLRAQQGA